MLTEIKNNLQGINNRVDKTKNQIINLDYKETNKQTNKQNHENREKK